MKTLCEKRENSNTEALGAGNEQAMGTNGAEVSKREE